MHRGAWHSIVHGIAELDTTEQLTLSLSTHLLNLAFSCVLVAHRACVHHCFVLFCSVVFVLQNLKKYFL